MLKALYSSLYENSKNIISMEISAFGVDILFFEWNFLTKSLMKQTHILLEIFIVK